MKFEWDLSKSAENGWRRGFDFAFASQVFLERCIAFPDDRRDYGEQRMLALGVVEGLPISVVFTDRLQSDGTPVRRIISARMSSRKERVRYAQAISIP